MGPSRNQPRFVIDFDVYPHHIHSFRNVWDRTDQFSSEVSIHSDLLRPRLQYGRHVVNSHFPGGFMRYFLTIALFLTLFGQTLSGQVKRVDDALLRNASKSVSDGDWLS